VGVGSRGMAGRDLCLLSSGMRNPEGTAHVGAGG